MCALGKRDLALTPRSGLYQRPAARSLMSLVTPKRWTLSETCHNTLVTRVFAVVVQFSKSCCLIPLKGLPTMMESTELLFQNIFQYFGIAEDIVSDRRPHFISRVWKSFFDLLCVTLSLSSAVERAEGKIDPGSLGIPVNLLPWQPEFLKPVPELGHICTKFL